MAVTTVSLVTVSTARHRIRSLSVSCRTVVLVRSGHPVGGGGDDGGLVGGGLLGPLDGLVLGFWLGLAEPLLLVLGLAEPLLLALGLAEPLRLALGLGLGDPLRLGLVLGLGDPLRLGLVLGLAEPLRLGLVLGLADPLRDGLLDGLRDGLCDGEALPLGHGDAVGDPDGLAAPLLVGRVDAASCAPAACFGACFAAADCGAVEAIRVGDVDGDGEHVAASCARCWRIRLTVWSTSAGSGCPGATHGSSMNNVPSIRRSHGCTSATGSAACAAPDCAAGRTVSATDPAATVITAARTPPRTARYIVSGDRWGRMNGSFSFTRNPPERTAGSRPEVTIFTWAAVRQISALT